MSEATNQIDAVVSALWAGVLAQQQAYNDATGTYYQMLWTHVAAPSEAVAADNLAARPTDQPASPIQGLPAMMRSRMRIDTYGQPAGWTMTLQTSIGGEVWQRSIDCGTDASRSSAWAALPALPTP